MDIQELEEKIETLRREIYELGESKKLNDDEMVKKSQELDLLLNQYNNLLKEK